MKEKKLDLTQENLDCQELDDDALEVTTGGATQKITCPRCGQRVPNSDTCRNCGRRLLPNVFV